MEQTLKGANDCVLKVIEIRKNELISISKDNLIKVWILNNNNEFNRISFLFKIHLYIVIFKN